MALSADLARPYETGPLNTFPVSSAQTIYRGSAVGINNGYARALSAGDAFVGFADAKADNSTGLDGAKNVAVKSVGLVRVTLASVAVTDVGKPVYMSDDATFTLTQGSNSYVGVVYRYETTNTCIVAFIAEGTLEGCAASGAALTASYILVGNSSNVAAERAVTGDIAINNSGAVTIANNAITTAKISDNQITTAKISASQVTSAKIASDAVLSGHISDASITTAKISDNQITTAKISASQVTSAKIASDNVLSGHISDATITFAKFTASCISQIVSACSSAGL